MNEYSIVLGAALPVFLLMLIGGVIRRLNWLTGEADNSLMQVVINLLIPALIFDSLLGNPALNEMKNVIVAPIIGFLTIVGGLFIAYWLGPLFGAKETVRRRTFGFVVGIYNYGYVPIPLTLLLFDRETLGVLFLFNLGVEISIWTIGLSLLQGKAGGRMLRSAFNPPMIAVFAGLLAHYAGLQAYIPEFISKSINLLGVSAIPLAVLLIGAMMADNLGEFDPKRGGRMVFGALFLRLGVFALLFLLLAVVLPVSQELKRVIVLQAAMPTATFPLIITKLYGGHVATALRAVFWTSFISLITIPLWIQFGLRWIGE
ncbi:MAG TPA: AEC family transporter [Opitutales bacterium]|nr:AEC family transporter [Opitutales bacterium]